MNDTWLDLLPYDAMGDYSPFHIERHVVRVERKAREEVICEDQGRNADREEATSPSVPCLWMIH